MHFTLGLFLLGLTGSVLSAEKYPLGQTGSVMSAEKCPLGQTGSVLSAEKYHLGQTGSVLSAEKYPLGQTGSVSSAEKYPLGPTGSVLSAEKHPLGQTGSVLSAEIHPLGLTGSVSLNSAGKYPLCDENNNVGLKREFGVLPARLAAAYAKRSESETPTIFCPGGVWSKYLFRYNEMVNGNKVYAYHEVIYPLGQKNANTIDYLRVYTKRWQQVANAILETNDPKEEGGILRIKYLLDNCDCVMRIYDLNQVDVVKTATTANCDGSDIGTSLQVFVRRSSSLRLPNCERGLNPGIYKFSRLEKLYEVIHKRIPSDSATDLQGSFTILYGSCSERVVLGYVVPGFCYEILYNGRSVGVILSKPYDDLTGRFNAKGYDYTEGFIIYPVTTPGKLRIKYLVDDCSCFVLLYEVPPSGTITRDFDLAPCDSFEGPEPGLWQPPTTEGLPKPEEKKSSCLGF